MQMHPITITISILFLVPLHLSLSSAADEAGGKKDIRGWCAGTPHPAACSLCLPRYCSQSPRDFAEFYQLSVHVAHSRVHEALSRMRSSPPSVPAWADCVELYGNAVFQLNRTLEAAVTSRGSVYVDTQTWLSAALTDLDMCRNGLASVGAPLGVLAQPAGLYVAELISNCLAVNGESSATDGTSVESESSETDNPPVKGTYPSWVRSGLRGRGLGEVDADAVVARDGTGKYRTIAAAVAAVARKEGRKVVYIKRGVYEENLNIPSDVTDLAFVGEGMGRTVISGSRSGKDGYSLITMATLAVFGDGFIARDLTIRNTYGSGSQAVALLLAADRSVVHRCRIDGHQDSLCTFSQRQFYRECQVFGTVDFIFGNAAAVLQNCTIFPRRPLPGQSDPITAQGRTDPNQNTGIVIHRSIIRPFADLYGVRPKVRVYLGRPWKEYSRTIYMQNYLSGILHPEGWLEWSGDFALSTLYYAEFKNWGPGSRMSFRVKWPGYHIIVKPSLVRKFTVGEFIAGGKWLPSTGTPFNKDF